MNKNDRTTDNPSLESLFRYTRNMGYQDYSSTMSAAFPGRDNERIRNRFLKGEHVDFEKEKKCQQGFIGLIRQSLEDQKKDVSVQNEYIYKIEKEVFKCEDELRDAQRKFERAKKNLVAAQRRREELMEDIEKSQKTLKNAIKVQKEIGIILLVHRTATVNQLKAYPLGDIYVSNMDIELVAEGIHDHLFYYDDGNDFITVIPECVRRLPPAIQLEYKAYANAVICFKLEEKNFVACYSSVEISELIKANMK